MRFLRISKKDQASQAIPGVKRLSMDCKATVGVTSILRMSLSSKPDGLPQWL
jgi:hypothetical protein